jgi:hypothetical protein
MTRGYVCSQEEVKAVHHHPTAEQQLAIDAYAAKFEACMARIPEGLHYLPGLGPVWFGVGPTSSTSES